ncbi:hypothetical protein RO3G_17376 [Rhizopus delemar RA 99-880]|uniref:Uncharacterized protein n=1 Tax=Rhizopus delemar (strain RA 99-880 / ATCC MYA-4621 / FGSC 9543 / NRRL 43880) TaxID=246409 RepID=I1CW35_RHIO9|nr:hypothetical protein RO3G_17376 [Rhizopus delemar RA 99-880]|eukprot:EIE92665.1 hypothetical protein RO3G_17376 [Rhizopus delemar RA 99-880]
MTVLNPTLQFYDKKNLDEGHKRFRKEKATDIYPSICTANFSNSYFVAMVP